MTLIPVSVFRGEVHLDVVIALLVYVAARITSIGDACARLRHAPDADIVLARLAHQLVDRETLDRRLRCLL